MTVGEYVSPSQAARILGLSSSRVVQLEREGRLVAFGTPIGRLFAKAEIQAFAERRAERQKSAAA
jgi:Helix-turn-helix domain